MKLIQCNYYLWDICHPLYICLLVIDEPGLSRFTGSLGNMLWDKRWDWCWSWPWFGFELWRARWLVLIRTVRERNELVLRYWFQKKKKKKKKKSLQKMWSSDRQDRFIIVGKNISKFSLGSLLNPYITIFCAFCWEMVYYINLACFDVISILSKIAHGICR